MEKWLESVYSDGSKYFVTNPLPKKGEEIIISIRVLEDNPITNIFLRAKHNGIEVLHEMVLDKTINHLQYYKVPITYYEDTLSYLFYIVTPNIIYYYNKYQITTFMPNEHYDFKILYDYIQPSWIKNAVFYQIFPERFCNGNKDNDVIDNEYCFDSYKTIKMNWEDTPLPYEKAHCLDFYGGDLEGITQKISYLKRLGVNCLYINPIFYGATCHKYDCLDYFEVDPHFGGNIALEKLTKALHQNGMKIILDVSINHTGIANKWFNKEGVFFDKSIGAYNNKNAKERNYYYFDKDNNYKCWLGIDTLPTLNYQSLELRNILYKNSDSLVKKWLKPPYNIDGWRFDVADIMARNDYIQLHHEVWPEIRKSIKEENPDAYILCEDWTDCSEFLKGKEWDSTMNYFGFARPIREFLGEGDTHSIRNPKLRIKYKMTANDLIDRFKQTLSQLPFVLQQNEFNLFDSHDVGRLHNNKDISFDEYRGAVMALFMMIGCPNVYYGDEADIDGVYTTEGCRYPMPWNKNFEKGAMYKLYHKLAFLKTTKDPLINGGYKFLKTDRYTWGLVRFNLEECFVFVMSTDDKESKIEIDMKIFGKENNIPNIDEFGYPLEFKEIYGKVLLTVKPHTSYLFNIK